jgi:hypothetical protein
MEKNYRKIVGKAIKETDQIQGNDKNKPQPHPIPAFNLTIIIFLHYCLKKYRA